MFTIYRCTCQNCTIMQHPHDCVCCREYPEVDAKVADWNEESGEEVTCITKHPGFETVCLDRWTLETAYYTYRQNFPQDANGIPNQHE